MQITPCCSLVEVPAGAPCGSCRPSARAPGACGSPPALPSGVPRTTAVAPSPACSATAAPGTRVYFCLFLSISVQTCLHTVPSLDTVDTNWTCEGLLNNSCDSRSARKCLSVLHVSHSSSAAGFVNKEDDVPAEVFVLASTSVLLAVPQHMQSQQRQLSVHE